jgi:hypothetical protein
MLNIFFERSDNRSFFRHLHSFDLFVENFEVKAMIHIFRTGWSIKKIGEGRRRRRARRRWSRVWRPSHFSTCCIWSWQFQVGNALFGIIIHTECNSEYVKTALLCKITSSLTIARANMKSNDKTMIPVMAFAKLVENLVVSKSITQGGIQFKITGNLVRLARTATN